LPAVVSQSVTPFGSEPPQQTRSPRLAAGSIQLCRFVESAKLLMNFMPLVLPRAPGQDPALRGGYNQSDDKK